MISVVQAGDKMDINLLKTAFRKLLTYTYFDKSDMVLRRNVALFADKLADEEAEETIFAQILKAANGEDEIALGQWLGQMQLVYLPKTLKPELESIEEGSHLITNVPPENMVAERLLIMADIPVELLILDVAWILLYGYKVDSKLAENSWGNRIDLVAGGAKVREGNSLFKKYHTQYRRWWQTGLNAANANLKKGKDVTIINFDIQNYYHSIDLDF